MASHSPRGSALVVVLVVLAVLSVLAMGAIAFTGSERDASVHESRSAELQACAETARAHVLARLRVVGIAPTEIEFVDALMDDYDRERRTVARTGHYGLSNATDGGVGTTEPGVELVVGGIGAMTSQARDLTNLVAAGGTLGGQFYRVVVACDSRGRQREVEFLVRFGI
jgi:hypothetical protein